MAAGIPGKSHHRLPKRHRTVSEPFSLEWRTGESSNEHFTVNIRFGRVSTTLSRQ